MLERLRRIYREFGWSVFARTILLLIGLVGMCLLGVIAFSSPWPIVLTVAGLVAGRLLRRNIVESFEVLSWALPGALFVYGVMLFIGERLGLSRESQLLIITATTVAVFDIQYWCFSDPSIVKDRAGYRG